MDGVPNQVSDSSAPAAEPKPAEMPTSAGRVPKATRRGAPASIMTIFLILLAVGGAIEGYAVSLAVSANPVGRQYSLVWAGLGAALVVTAWGLRGRRWWAAAAAIGVAIVGFVAGLYGIYGLIVLANAVDCPADATGHCLVSSESWLIGVGLVAVGAASIATIGLLSTAWTWLTAAGPSRSN